MGILSSIAGLGTKAVSAVTGGWVGWAVIGGTITAAITGAWLYVHTIQNDLTAARANVAVFQQQANDAKSTDLVDKTTIAHLQAQITSDTAVVQAAAAVNAAAASTHQQMTMAIQAALGCVPQAPLPVGAQAPITKVEPTAAMVDAVMDLAAGKKP